MPKVVLNAQYGGFSLSQKAKNELVKLGYDGSLDDSYIPRDNPLLVKVVEKLGKAASGNCASLVIEKVDDDKDYVIDEYDGLEGIRILPKKTASTKEKEAIEIVVNGNYGGFSLSTEAKKLLAKLGYEGDTYYIPRHHPLLIKVVKKLGKKANGSCASLCTDTVLTSDRNYWIVSYDGAESAYGEEPRHSVECDAYNNIEITDKEYELILNYKKEQEASDYESEVELSSQEQEDEKTPSNNSAKTSAAQSPASKQKSSFESSPISSPKKQVNESKDVELIKAVEAGDLAKVTKLLKAGAKGDIRAHGYFTALHLAAISQHNDAKNIVSLLLENGANTKAKDHWNKTPLEFMQTRSYINPEIKKLLEAADKKQSSVETKKDPLETPADKKLRIYTKIDFDKITSGDLIYTLKNIQNDQDKMIYINDCFWKAKNKKLDIIFRGYHMNDILSILPEEFRCEFIVGNIDFVQNDYVRDEIIKLLASDRDKKEFLEAYNMKTPSATVTNKNTLLTNSKDSFFNSTKPNMPGSLIDRLAEMKDDNVKIAYIHDCFSKARKKEIEPSFLGENLNAIVRLLPQKDRFNFIKTNIAFAKSDHDKDEIIKLLPTTQEKEEFLKLSKPKVSGFGMSV